ncbi:MAG: peptidase M50 [Chloroflexi bacterium]|nr:MAG: peptidase M50 [Chloroflexota bacterium]
MRNHTPPAYVVSLDAVEAIREAIPHLFIVTDTTLDWPEKGHFRFRGRFVQEADVCFDELRSIFEAHGFTPLVREDNGRLAIEALPAVFHATPSNWRVNLVLFLATLITTMFIGAFYEGVFFPENVEITSLSQLVTSIAQNWTKIIQGWPFCLSIMTILGLHELGHYIAARYHNVPVTLPYFIPMPFSIIGTMGAVIRLKGPVKNKRALLDVGAAGPIVGFIVAVPIFLYGLYTSDLRALPVGEFQYEGNSLMYILAKFIIFQRYLPADGVDVYLNQVAWAAWVGLLVTGLNLIPVGQLDGGHVSYALFGKKASQLFLPVIIGLLLLVVLGNAFVWVLWIFLLLAFGRTYAEPLDDVTPLDTKRKVIAILTLALFVLLFVPLPFRMITA